MSRLLRQLCVLTLLLLWAALGHAAVPMVRVHVLGKQPALVNQQIRFEVEILTPNYFTSAPPFPVIQIPGAIVTMPDESGQNIVEQVNGQTYAGIVKTYVFAAQQAGDFVLPPLVVKFTYGADDGKSTPGQVTLPPTKITAKLPDGAIATPGGTTQPVAKVTIKQSFDRAPSGKAIQLQAGDALVRTVDTYAELTQAMMIPPPKIDAPNGVRIFAADPKLNDITKDRVGLVGGQRTDKITYVFEKTGNYTLPAISVGWFNASTNKPETAVAPAVTVVVAVRTSGEAIAPEEAAVPVAEKPRSAFWRHIAWRQWLGAAVILLALVVAARWLMPRLRAWRAAQRQRQAERAISEPVLFEAAAAVCRKGKAAASYAALIGWSRQGLGCGVGEWSEQIQDSELAREWSVLETQLYSGAGPSSATAWTPDALLRALHQARKRCLQADHAGQGTSVLPALNPGPLRGAGLGLS